MSDFAGAPERQREERRIIGFGQCFPSLVRAFTARHTALRAHAFVLVHAPEQLIPNLEEKPSMVWLVQRRFGVMHIMLKRRIDERMMRIGPIDLVAPMQVNAVPVKQDGEHAKQEVHVDGHHERKNNQRRGAKELVNGQVRNDRERAGIVKRVMMPMLFPRELADVAEPVVRKFEEIGRDPNDEKRQDQIPHAVGARSTIGL